MRLRPFLPVALVAFALLFSGCDGVDSDLDSEFIASITGDVTADLTGEAVYTVFDGTSGPTFALFFFGDNLFANDRREYTFVTLHRPGDRPGVGAFPIDSSDPSNEAFGGSFADLVDADRADATGPVLTATDGVLTITAFETGFLHGSFRFDGTGLFLPDNSAFIDATISGTFEARFVEPSVIQGLDIDFDFD